MKLQESLSQCQSLKSPKTEKEWLNQILPNAQVSNDRNTNLSLQNLLKHAKVGVIIYTDWDGCDLCRELELKRYSAAEAP